MRAQANGHAARHHFENPTHRIAGAQHVIHFRFHSRFGAPGRCSAAGFEVFANRDDLVPSGVAFETHMAHSHDVAEHLDAEFPQQALCHRACRHPRRCFAGGGPLQHVTRIMKIEFLRTREIGVAGAGRSQVALGIVGAIAILDRQSFLPIFPVAILEAHRDRRPNGLAMPHTRKKSA